MFEAAEIKHGVDKTTFEREEPRLREALIAAQAALAEKRPFAVVILIAGLAGSGKGDVLATLNEWLDPRLVETVDCDDPSDEERERPYMFRYWRALPPKGRIGVFLHSWYQDPAAARAKGDLARGDLDQRLAEIRRFERMLADEGALILKFWFHLSKKRQKKRLKQLASDPETSWRVSDRDWDFFKLYDRFYRVSEDTLRETSTRDAPWIVVEGSDPEYRAVTVGRTLLEAMRKRLSAPPERRVAKSQAAPMVRPVDQVHVLRRMNLNLKLERDEYKKRLEKYQRRLALITLNKKFPERNVVCVFEGMDAAGKGGAIRRITAALDPRLYHNIPVAAPTDEERAQPYLWRFWRHLPRKGRFTIYDRSWYGRVLVERIEGFCSEADWMRAYSEINDFEEQLARNGAIICKFWLQISKTEQFKRFKLREKTRFKRFKITPEDWRNREKWSAYEVAASDMIERTSTSFAPWTLIEANDKYHARAKVVGTVVRAIENALGKR
jgi:polyphosphate:AMP phosphotransferase